MTHEHDPGDRAQPLHPLPGVAYRNHPASGLLPGQRGQVRAARAFQERRRGNNATPHPHDRPFHRRPRVERIPGGILMNIVDGLHAEFEKLKAEKGQAEAALEYLAERLGRSVECPTRKQQHECKCTNSDGCRPCWIDHAKTEAVKRLEKP